MKLEFKASLAVDDAGTITGIAWPFGSPDRVGDVIVKGAFGKVRRPLPMLFGHNPDDPVGSWDDIEEGDDGLNVTGRLLIEDLPRAREVRAMVRSGAVSGLSIGFQTKKSTPRKGGGRTISSLDLVEISLVSVPMHPGARVIRAKSAARAIQVTDHINRLIAHWRA